MIRFTKHLHLYLLIGLAVCLSACPALGTKVYTENLPSGEAIRTADLTLDANIKTILLYRETDQLSVPVTFMGSFDPLTLEFDELRSAESRESDFFVDIQACNEYWEPASMLPIQFYDGFTQDRIQQVQRSEFTKVEYVHYTYQFPQEGETFTKSGNYLLKVFREGDPNAVVLTRRFVVVEPLVGISLANELSQNPRRRRMEALSLLVNPGTLNVFNPMMDLHINLVPNFRLDRTAELTPQRMMENSLLCEVNLLRSFPFGHEFRSADIRSTRFLSAQIQDVEEREDIFDVYLFADAPWLSNRFGRQPDLNGNFMIEVQEWPHPSVQADYVYTYFSLPLSSPLSGQEVYILGKCTDWAISTANKMRWNETLSAYEGELLLKQGIYDYQYVTAPTPSEQPSSIDFQGQLTDAENQYYVLVYYRGPTDLNDRVVGFWAVNGS